MLKKICLLFSTVLLTLSLAVSCFAYNSMYNPASGIPDFSEVTHATLLNKQYYNNSTVYTYDKRYIAQTNFDLFTDMMYAAGYVYYYAMEDANNIEQVHGFINTNRGLEIYIKWSALNQNKIMLEIRPYSVNNSAPYTLSHGF